jgi:hypothetical protein
MSTNKHDRRFKRHAIHAIEFRGKADSAYVTCSCGYVECHASWWNHDDLALTGWTDTFGNPLPVGLVSRAVYAFCNLYLYAPKISLDER